METTFGCSAQHTNPTNFCVNCGNPLGNDQAFCTKCGTPKAAAPKKNICGKCGNELQDGQEFCPKCGQKAGVAVDNSLNAAINQFNAGVEKKKKKSKVVPIVIAVVLAVAVAIGMFVSKTMSAKKAEEIKKEYIQNVEEFLALSLDAGVNLEDISDTIVTYWHEHIYEDKHGSSIDTAILYALMDKSDELEQAEEYDSQMKDSYSEIKNVPKGLAEEDVDEIEELRDAAKDLYNIYTDFYSMATDPTGSYNTYSEDNNEITNEFLSCYRALENLLD